MSDLRDDAPQRLSTQPARPGRPVGLGPAGWARWFWRQLTSMRVALLLLFLLAVASVPGSVFPQRGASPLAVTNYLRDNPTWGPWLDRLGMFDVFAAPWYAAIYLLLMVSLTGCVIPRARLHWRAMRARPPAAPRNLARLPEHRSWVSDLPPAGTTAAAEHTARALRRRRWRVVVEGSTVSAEKGYLRETGNLVFHVALLCLLLAVGFGALTGSRGQVIVTTGDGFADTPSQFDSFSSGRFADPADLPPFAFTLEDFRVRFEPQGSPQAGAPREFAADLQFTREPGGPQENFTISSNNPLSIDGTKIFLVGHGYAPIFTVRDGSGRVVFDGPVNFLPQDANFTSTGVIKVPDTVPQLGFQGLFLPSPEFSQERGFESVYPDANDPQVILKLWAGNLGLDSGSPQSIYRLDTRAMQEVTDPDGQIAAKAMLVGQTWDLPRVDGVDADLGSITFDGYTRFATFNIARDPGKEWALAAAALAILGLCGSLFVRRRRAWVRLGDDGAGRTLVEVAGLARSEAAGLSDEVDLLAREVAEVAPPESATPAGPAAATGEERA